MKDQCRRHNERSKGGGGIEQLLCRNAGIFVLLPPKILCCDDCTAGSKRGEHLNKQDIDRIHQGDPRHSGFPHARDHDGIRHTDRNSQKLLNHERDQQPHERPAGKKQRTIKLAILTHPALPPYQWFRRDPSAAGASMLPAAEGVCDYHSTCWGPLQEAGGSFGRFPLFACPFRRSFIRSARRNPAG